MAVTVERLIATLEARIDKYEKNLQKAYGRPIGSSIGSSGAASRWKSAWPASVLVLAAPSSLLLQVP